MRQIILDTETTGLHVAEGHRIIEIGCVELVNRKLTGKHFHHYIHPERNVEAGALAVHGITDDFLRDKPLFSAIVEKFMDFIDGAELVIHNAAFDIGFLNAELALLRKSWQPVTHYCRVVDSLLLARQLHIGQRNSLDALCKRYGVDNSERGLHGALLDAHLLARVYLAMTGGQATLFEESETVETTAQQNESTDVHFTKQTHHLHILKATSDEATLHAEYLQNMQTKGKCLWQEEEFIS